MDSIVSRNPFELLVENSASSAPAKSSATKKDTAPKKETVAPRKDVPTFARGSRSGTRGGYRNVGQAEGAESQTARRNGRQTGSERGRGGSRGGRRQFDRQSGTGLVDSDKKKVQGWLGKDEATVTDAKVAADEANQESTAFPDAEAAKEEPVEEDNTITYEQYVKDQANSVSQAKEVRKPNQGVTIDKAVLVEAVPLKKEEDFFFAPTISAKVRKSKQLKEKVHVAIEQRFVETDNRRSRFTKTDSRGGSNLRGRKDTSKIDISNESEFPSL